MSLLIHLRLVILSHVKQRAVLVKLKRKPETKGHVISQNLHVYNQLLQHLKIT